MIIMTFFRWKSQHLLILCWSAFNKKAPWLFREINNVPWLFMATFVSRVPLTLKVCLMCLWQCGSVLTMCHPIFSDTPPLSNMIVPLFALLSCKMLEYPGLLWQSIWGMRGIKWLIQKNIVVSVDKNTQFLRNFIETVAHAINISAMGSQ